MINNLSKKTQTTNKNKKEKFIKNIFSDISQNYDLMNDIMSLGLHRIWKEELIKLVNFKESDLVLDLAAGSGDITKEIKRNSNCTCIVCDPNIKMIKMAKKKLNHSKLKFICAKCEELPFKNNTFDYVFVSFGLRNFSDKKKSLLEITRILKKNGKFLCLEFSEINNPLIRKLFYFYSKIIPIYGKVIANNKEAYNYLIRSIKSFPNQIKLTKMLLAAGFKKVDVTDILGGLASIHIAKK